MTGMLRRLRPALLLRIALGAFGLWVLSIGARGLLLGHPFVWNKPVGKWLLNGLLVHDALIAPVVFVCCAIAYRVTSMRVRRALAAILLIGGSAVIIALPDILRKGHNSNPTVTPLDYRGNLIIVLLAVVGGAVLVTAASARRAARQARREVALETAETALIPKIVVHEAEAKPEAKPARKPAPKPAPEPASERRPEPEAVPDPEPQEADTQIHPTSGIELFDHDEVQGSTPDS